MLKFIFLLLVLMTGLNNNVPAPEIAAEPLPRMVDRVTRPFEGQPYFKASGHRGIDLADMTQELIRSPFAGKVSFSGIVFSRSVVTIRSESGLLASLEPVCANVSQGQEVSAGEVVGSWCQPDEDYQQHCEGCVHFSVRSQRGYLNPLLFYGLVRPSKIVA